MPASRDFIEVWQTTVNHIPTHVAEREIIVSKKWIYVSPELTWTMAEELLREQTGKYASLKLCWWLHMWATFTGRDVQIFIDQ